MTWARGRRKVGEQKGKADRRVARGDGKDRDWLGMNAPIERRDRLNGLLVGTGLALAGCAPSGSEGARIAAAEPQNQQGYYPPQRMGMRGNHPGSFENAHALRDGTLKPEHAEKTGEDYDQIGRAHV